MAAIQMLSVLIKKEVTTVNAFQASLVMAKIVVVSIQLPHSLPLNYNNYFFLIFVVSQALYFPQRFHVICLEACTPCVPIFYYC